MSKYLSFVVFALLLSACSPSTQSPTTTAIPTSQPTQTQTSVPTPTFSPEPLISYIGQALPGAEPQRFGLSFFSGEFHSAPVFSPDGETVWWAGDYGSATIYTSQWVEGAWTDPAVITFSDAIKSYRDPFISPDGIKFYFISEAAVAEGIPGGKENIWMMSWEGDSWSMPTPLPEAVNSLSLHWTVSVADNYDLYFSAVEEGNTDIFISRFVEGEYTEPEQMDAPINTADIEITPNIAPDGSYLLFTRIKDRTSSPYLYISYADEAGWSEPVKVENINYCISPIVTPDRSYVIYLSSPASFEWRDTTFIEELRP